MSNRRYFLKLGALSLASLSLIKCKWTDESVAINNNLDMKCIGLIGGTSWHSTVSYYSYINQLVNEVKGERINPPVLLYNLNQKQINDLQAQDKWDEIASIYISISKNLINAGAEALVFCSNTAHSVYEEVSKAIDKPILHIADATGIEAKKQGLKTLGLLGTNYTMNKPFLKNRLRQEFGFKVLTPEVSSHKELMRIIYKELAKGKIESQSVSFVVTEMNKLKEQGAEGIILGCTEFPLLLKLTDYVLPLLDTTYLHCKMATNFIIKDP